MYELDGLQRGPIEVGKYSNDWIPVANVAIQERIATYSQVSLPRYGDIGSVMLATLVW